MSDFAPGDEVTLEGHPQKYLVVADFGSTVVVVATEPSTVAQQVFGYTKDKVSEYVEPTNPEEASEPDAESTPQEPDPFS